MPVLIALCLTVYLPGFFSIPPVDRDESRFAQASRQMFESIALPEAEQTAGFHDGGLVVPKFQDKPRLNKPPLIYWLQSTAAAVFTGGDPLKDAIWMYRVPSLLAGIGTVLLVWFLGKSMFNRRVAFLAAAFIGLSPVFVWEAHQARADQVLVFWTVLAQVALWKVWGKARSGGGGNWIWAGVFWCAVGLGVLTKGPITPLVCGLTVLALCITTRRWRWVWGLKPIVGVVLAAALVAPWVIAIGNHPLVGWDRLFEIANDEVFGRSIEAKEGHWGPPGYHLVLLPVLLWPGSMMVGIAFPFAIKRVFTSQNRARQEAALGGPANSPVSSPAKNTQSKTSRFPHPNPSRSAELFCLAWIIPSWLVFELVGTKLPHYTMPLYPAVAILCARTLQIASEQQLQLRWPGLLKPALVLWIHIGWALYVVVQVAFFARPGSTDHGNGANIAVAATIGVCALLLATAMHAIISKRIYLARAQLLTCLASICGLLGLLGAALPRTDFVWTSTSVKNQLQDVDPPLARPIAAVDYHEPSLVFLTRGTLQIIESSSLPEWSAAHPNGLVILSGHEPTQSDGESPMISGWNYSSGQWVELSIVDLAK